MFTLTVRFANRRKIDLNIAEAKLPTWTRYATDTDNMREVSTAALGSDAKQKFISTAHGGAIPICSDPTVKSFIEQVSSEARLLRWLACSAMPSLCDRFLCDRDVHLWPQTHLLSSSFGRPWRIRLNCHGSSCCSRKDHVT